MLGWSDVELAAIVFHELAHQLLYVPGDSDFNEALATVVEREGVRRWLSNSGRGKDLENYELQEGRVAQVVALLIEGRAALADAYRLPLPAEEMRRRKALEFAHLREQFTTLKAGWGAHAPFETWFGPSLNNANLASVATYRACVPGLERVLTGAGGDLPRFYAKAREIAALSADRRHAQACGAG
jgi:predicted aminopeptidase